MKITLDGQEYAVDMKTVMKNIEDKYDAIKDLPVMLPDGTLQDISPKGFKRIALSLTLIPFIYPMLRYAYTLNGLELPLHDKKEDFINYAILCILRLIGHITDKSILNVTSIANDASDSKTVTTIVTARGDRTGDETGTSGDNEGKSIEGAGRATHVYSG